MNRISRSLLLDTVHPSAGAGAVCSATAFGRWAPLAIARSHQAADPLHDEVRPEQDHHNCREHGNVAL